MFTVTERDIQELAERIVAGFKPQRIILFGSHARGDATGESDVDLLVVVPGDEPRYKSAGRIRASLRLDIPLDIVVRRPAEFENCAGDPLVLDVRQHGRVLYAA
jgi:predicted nucleotidyltransferase